MATKPEFLVAKEKMLVALVIVSVAISSPDVLDFMPTFLHCLSSQNYMAKPGSYQHESTFFLVNQISVDIIILKNTFHIYNLFKTYSFTALY